MKFDEFYKYFLKVDRKIFDMRTVVGEHNTYLKQERCSFGPQNG